MIDLVYFGYEWDDNSLKNQEIFKKSILNIFPNVKLVNAYDDIKGYRQEIYLNEDQKDDYYAWIIGNGWVDSSFIIQTMILDKSKESEFNKIWSLAKIKYPKSFKN